MPACCRAHLPSVPYLEISSHPGPFPELSLDRFYLPHHHLGDSCANHRSLRRCDLSHIHSLAPPVSGVQGWEYLGSKTIHFACLVAGSAPPAVTLQGREAPERRESLSPREVPVLSQLRLVFISITAPMLSLRVQTSPIPLPPHSLRRSAFSHSAWNTWQHVWLPPSPACYEAQKRSKQTCTSLF